VPRRRPGRLRRQSAPHPDDGREHGLPGATAQALERLAEPGLDPRTVAVELQVWRDVVSLPRATLSAPHNDWTEFVGPGARAVLADAVQALDRRDGAPLRAELARLDALFERKTSPNPLADPTLPWWSRRWSH
jgi:hypothetical protein